MNRRGQLLSVPLVSVANIVRSTGISNIKRKDLKRVITIADDFAFGYEQMAGFQRVFEDGGGRVVKKLWPPIVTPDYTPYLAQLSGVDAVVQGFAGSNPLRFMKQYRDAGLKLPILGGGPACDDALLKSFGDEAIGLISCSAYTGGLTRRGNKRLIEGMVKDYGNIPGSTPPASTSTAWWPRRRSRRPAARPTTGTRSSRRCARCR
jgi:ABC-type branched-subunit amino acid transport system substrate-binding protein